LTELNLEQLSKNTFGWLQLQVPEVWTHFNLRHWRTLFSV